MPNVRCCDCDNFIPIEDEGGGPTGYGACHGGPEDVPWIALRDDEPPEPPVVEEDAEGECAYYVLRIAKEEKP